MAATEGAQQTDAPQILATLGSQGCCVSFRKIHRLCCPMRLDKGMRDKVLWALALEMPLLTITEPGIVTNP